ncbi:MAG: hypothetical protein ACQES5_02370 [Thermodesulfobacteriota bacterium]
MTAGTSKKRIDPAAAIRWHCRLCMNGSRKMIAECSDRNCLLYPFRNEIIQGEKDLFRVINAYCACCAGGENLIRECDGKFLSGKRCPLWPLRFGPLGYMGAFMYKA